MSSELVRGVVANCMSAQVFEYPSEDAQVIKYINALTDVMVEIDDFDYEFSDFYKICTETGLEGYCLKKFIAVPFS